MTRWFDVDAIWFTVLGYPLSYVETIGTALYLASVILIARRNVLTWPVGIVSVLLFLVLFYQIRLYSDAIEQLYYLGASAYGWWFWRRTEPGARVVRDVGFSAARGLLVWLAFTAAASVALGTVMVRVHTLVPALFPEPASFPYLDAVTTVMSLVAMWLMARKRTESWAYWIVVDVIAIWLYAVKGVMLLALLYVALLIIAVRGLVAWSHSKPRQRRSSSAASP